MLNTYLVTLVLMNICVSCTYSDLPNETLHRVKRGKYYSSAPQRFYRRPPPTYPVRGAFSYTPPPNYMDDEEPYPGPKVPNGLGDEDINNIVKYLSKQDLDRIIEFASEKERSRDDYIERKPFKREESRLVAHEFSDKHSRNAFRSHDEQTLNMNGPYRTPSSHSFKDDQKYGYHNTNTKQYSGNFKLQDNGPSALREDLLNHVEDATQSKVIHIDQDNGYLNAPLQTEQSQSQQISHLNTYISNEINNMTPGNGPVKAFTDDQIVKEETLPKPVNLREDDFDISFTNNVPTVVRRPSYDVRSFGELPLMSNSYKLDTVSSYKVPHYTVTSNTKYGAPSSTVSLEPAPPKSEAKEQSDAHLKAIKIWTHRSKGTAYTLHNDGTLSLERTSRPKTNYGP